MLIASGPSLHGCYLKLARADQHFESIRQAISDLRGSDPVLLPGEFSPRVGKVLFKAQHESPPDHFLSAEIGDFLHNVRSALDYLVCELVLVGGRSPTGKTAFPIFTDPNRYAKESQPKIDGVPPTAPRIFEQLQPFYGPNSNPFHPQWRDPAREPLALFYELNNADKHRTLNLTEQVATVKLVGLPPHVHVGPPAKSPGPFVPGVVVAGLISSEPVEGVRMEATFEIGFDRRRTPGAGGEEVISTLDAIRQTVRTRVLPRFIPFFPSP